MSTKNQSKELTYEELIQIAKKHYSEGGDGIVECWDKVTFDNWVEMFGPITKKVAMELIRL